MDEIKLDYDPDFDGEDPKTAQVVERGSLFTSPIAAFYTGIVTAILGVCTIGFFVLLFVLLR